MDVKVLFFARSRELAGASEGSVTLPKGAGTIQLVESLMEKYPKLQEIRGSFILSLNQEYLGLDEDALIKSGDEIAVIPPISGG